MTNSKKYTFGFVLIFASMIMAVSMIKIDSEGGRLLAFGIIFILLKLSTSLLSSSTDIKRSLVPGRVYKLISYRTLKNGENVTNFVTLKFISKNGNCQIHTFVNPEFGNKDVSFQYEEYEFTAIQFGKKIILRFNK